MNQKERIRKCLNCNPQHHDEIMCFRCNRTIEDICSDLSSSCPIGLFEVERPEPIIQQQIPPQPVQNFMPEKLTEEILLKWKKELEVCQNCEHFESRKTEKQEVLIVDGLGNYRLGFNWCLYMLGISEPKCTLQGGCTKDLFNLLISGKCPDSGPDGLTRWI